MSCPGPCLCPLCADIVEKVSRASCRLSRAECDSEFRPTIESECSWSRLASLLRAFRFNEILTVRTDRAFSKYPPIGDMAEWIPARVSAKIGGVTPALIWLGKLRKKR